MASPNVVKSAKSSSLAPAGSEQGAAGGHTGTGSTPTVASWCGGTNSPSAEQASSRRATAPSARSRRNPTSKSQQEWWCCLRRAKPGSPPSCHPLCHLLFPPPYYLLRLQRMEESPATRLATESPLAAFLRMNSSARLRPRPVCSLRNSFLVDWKTPARPQGGGDRQASAASKWGLIGTPPPMYQLGAPNPFQRLGRGWRGGFGGAGCSPSPTRAPKAL